MHDYGYVVLVVVVVKVFFLTNKYADTERTYAKTLVYDFAKSCFFM